MAALTLRLRASLELADECARLMPLAPDQAGELGALCLDHLAHAVALTGLILEGRPSCTDNSGTTVSVDVTASLMRLSTLVREAREAASRECLAASDAREVGLLGMIAVALASHEELLRGSDQATPG